jgi:hypothetical protein
MHNATEGHLRWDDFIGPAPNGFNTDLTLGASFIIDVTFKAIDVATHPCDSTWVEYAEDTNSLHTGSYPSIARIVFTQDWYSIILLMV